MSLPPLPPLPDVSALAASLAASFDSLRAALPLLPGLSPAAASATTMATATATASVVPARVGLASARWLRPAALSLALALPAAYAAYCYLFRWLPLSRRRKDDWLRAVFFDSALGYALVRAIEPPAAAQPHRRSPLLSSPLLSGPFEIVIVPCLDDNYSYLIVDRDQQTAIIVDPSDAKIVLRILAERSLRPIAILNTHKHWDHCSGNARIVAKYSGLSVYGSQIDFKKHTLSHRLQCTTHFVRDNDVLTIGRAVIQVLLVPCHTRGSVLYMMDMERSLAAVANAPAPVSAVSAAAAAAAAPAAEASADPTANSLSPYSIAGRAQQHLQPRRTPSFINSLIGMVGGGGSASRGGIPTSASLAQPPTSQPRSAAAAAATTAAAPQQAGQTAQSPPVSTVSSSAFSVISASSAREAVLSGSATGQPILSMQPMSEGDHADDPDAFVQSQVLAESLVPIPASTGDWSPLAPCVFTGDTLMTCGVGRFFEATSPYDMHQIIARLLATLPPSTNLFPGHEYSVSNLAFARLLEPGNFTLQLKFKQAEDAAWLRIPMAPTSWQDEILYNPFLRVDARGRRGELWRNVNTHASLLRVSGAAASKPASAPRSWFEWMASFSPARASDEAGPILDVVRREVVAALSPLGLSGSTVDEVVVLGCLRALKDRFHYVDGKPQL